VNLISSKTQRAVLAPRREPYWFRIRAGVHVGYRKPEQGEGTWLAKYRDDAGERHYKTLGTILDDDSRSAFTKASREVEAWLGSIDAGATPKTLTVREACEQHIAALRIDDDDEKADAEGARFRRYVYDDPIARVELSKLKPADLTAWKGRLKARPAKVSRSPDKNETRERSPATINRDMVPMRAALNRARNAGLVASDQAWRSALTPIDNADRKRELYLDRNDRRAFIDKAPAEIQPLLRALALLPLRPGALAALTAGDYNPKLHSLRVGKDKTGNDRRITVPAATAEFLAAQCKGKLPGAALLPRPDGSHWNKDAWKWPIKDAVLAAGLPTGATAYTMRHSVITDLVTAGLPLLTIAQISGTSVAMIERFYGHLQQKQAAAALATLAL
jgi:site-specific recombinase XerD